MRIVAVGECTLDRYRDRGIERPGGISLNFSVSAALAGADTALVSCVGGDGVSLIAGALARAGVDGSHLHRRPGRTASQLIEIAEGGERIFPPGGYDPGVLADWRFSADDAAFVATFDIVAAPCFRQVAHLFDAAMAAARPGAKRVADLLDGADLGPDWRGLARLPARLDLAFVSGPPSLVDQLAAWSESVGTALVVTHGAAGSTAMIGGRRFEQAAVAVPTAERLDTTGCGDAFQAAFTTAYYRVAPVSVALRTGAARAAAVIRHLGAIPD